MAQDTNQEMGSGMDQDTDQDIAWDVDQSMVKDAGEGIDQDWNLILFMVRTYVWLKI